MSDQQQQQQQNAATIGASNTRKQQQNQQNNADTIGASNTRKQQKQQQQQNAAADTNNNADTIGASNKTSYNKYKPPPSTSLMSLFETQPLPPPTTQSGKQPPPSTSLMSLFETQLGTGNGIGSESNSIFKDRIQQQDSSSVNNADANADVNSNVNTRINTIFKKSLHKSFDIDHDDDDGFFSAIIEEQQQEPIQSNNMNDGNDAYVNSSNVARSNSIFRDKVRQKSSAINEADTDVNVNATINNIFTNSLHKSFDIDTDDDGFFLQKSSTNHSPPDNNSQQQQQQQQQQTVFLNIPELTSTTDANKNDSNNNKHVAAAKGKIKKGRHRRKSTMSSIGMNSFTSSVSGSFDSADYDNDNVEEDFDFFDIPALVLQGRTARTPPRPSSSSSLYDDGNRKEFASLRLGKSRRLSMTTDLETGRSPLSRTTSLRGQRAVMRRSTSTDMMEAQSPRVRRRKQISHNMESFRKAFSTNVEKKLKSTGTSILKAHPMSIHTPKLPDTTSDNQSVIPPDIQRKLRFSEGTKDKLVNNDKKNGNDWDHDSLIIELEEGRRHSEKSTSNLFPAHHHQPSAGSLISSGTHSKTVLSTDKQRRERYDVKQNTNAINKEVQYRLTAITPREIHRRRSRSIRESMTKVNIGNNSNSVGSSLEQCIDDSTNNNKDNNNSNKKKNNVAATIGSSLLASITFKLNQLKARIIDGLAEIAIITLSQRKRRSSNGLLNKYLFWTFRSRFLTVFFSAVFAFYSITLLFAIFIYWLGINHSKCIHVNGEDFGADTDAPFTDAFALSWTTFTTVGYGSIHPGTSITIGPSYNVAKECTGIMIVTAMEAFVGILFSATFGAIFFAKVTRVSAFAQISFSDAIIVKYSTGLTGQQDDDDNDENDDGVSSDDSASTSSLTYKRSKLPCPFFEFRIANRLHRTRGGEIIDASINIVASIDEKQAAAQLRGVKTVDINRGTGARGRRRNRAKKAVRNYNNNNIMSPIIGGFSRQQSGADRDLFRNDINIKQAKDAARRMVLSYTSKQAAAAAATAAGLNLEEEDKDANSIPKRVFAKLHVESQEHPFFNRIWNVRHVLDQTSPLLRPEAKELIRFNNGHWPNELNNANALRASIHFDQILVSFSGTSNVDANSVYSQKSYGFDDLCVGYAFVNMLYRERDGSIGVDHRLLNDVNEQSGGGGEELNLRESALLNSRVSSDILIL